MDRMFVFASLLLAGTAAVAAPWDSTYSDLNAKTCTTVSANADMGASTQKCGGTAGYSLLVDDFDGRVTVTVLAPNGRKFPLDYSRTITSGFSSLGPKAEWRLDKQGGKSVPAGLIIRVFENSGNGRKTSTLAVAKITANAVCVTDKVKTNEEARAAAEAAAGKSCL